jgi:3-dehydroquinate synthase
MGIVNTLEIKTNTGTSRILIGETLDNLGEYTPDDRTVIVTDTNVSRLYGNRFPSWERIEIETGESIKTLDTVRDIYGRLVELEVDRTCFIIGIGGGIVCDIAGFVSSTFLRGLEFGFVSTTLLSQVDASVGGKNGVNFQGYKNMVGVFNQPRFVLCDLGLLKTLPRREILCGLGEVVKHALLGDAPLFDFLEEHHEQAVALDGGVIERLVYDSVVLKADIVGKDERERGERRKLNFGHTFGHALEIQTDFNHGEAVSAGMIIACFASAQRGYLDMETLERIARLLDNLHLPTSLPVAPQGILDALRKDKKRKGDSIHFVLLREIGHAVIEEISLGELEDLLHGFCDWERSGLQ